MTTRTTTQAATQPKRGLSKSRLIAWRQCPRRLWLEVNRPDQPLFEPAFQHDGLLVRIDLLLPEDTAGRHHHLVEVKSTASVKDYHLPDAAIQAWVAGLDLARVSIAPLMEQVPDWTAEARAVLAGGQPDIEPGDQCDTPFACPFQRRCCPPATEYPAPSCPIDAVRPWSATCSTTVGWIPWPLCGWRGSWKREVRIGPGIEPRQEARPNMTFDIFP